MSFTRKGSRPAGIILISFLKLILIIFLILGITTIIARYKIEFLKLEKVKVEFIDRIIYYIFPKGNEITGILSISGIVAVTVTLLGGMWYRKQWVWFLEFFIFSIGTVVTLFLIFNTGNIQIAEISYKIDKKIGVIFLINLILGFTFILYLTKKNVRDYFGIFKRRLR